MIKEHDAVMVPGTVIHLYPETPNMKPHCEVEVGRDTVTVPMDVLLTPERIAREIPASVLGRLSAASLALCKQLLVQERVEAERDLRDAEFAWRDAARVDEAQQRLERVLVAELELNQIILEPR